jgi:hypothetical protein
MQLKWDEQKVGDVVVKFCEWYIYICAGLLIALFMCLLYAFGNVLYVCGAWPVIGRFALWTCIVLGAIIVSVVLLILLIVGLVWAGLKVSNFYLDWKEWRERREAQKLR